MLVDQAFTYRVEAGGRFRVGQAASLLGGLHDRRGRCCSGSEVVGPRHGPRIAEAGMGGARAREKLARRQEAIDFRERDNAVGSNPAHEMVRTQLAWMIEAGCPYQLGEGVDGFLVEVGDPHGLVGDDYGSLA